MVPNEKKLSPQNQKTRQRMTISRPELLMTSRLIEIDNRTWTHRHLSVWREKVGLLHVTLIKDITYWAYFVSNNRFFRRVHKHVLYRNYPSSEADLRLDILT